MAANILIFLHATFVWLASALFPPGADSNPPQAKIEFRTIKIGPPIKSEPPRNKIVVTKDGRITLNGEALPIAELRVRLLKEKFKDPSTRVGTYADSTPSNIETVFAVSDLVKELDMQWGLATKPIIKPKSTTP